MTDVMTVHKIVTRSFPSIFPPVMWFQYMTLNCTSIRIWSGSWAYLILSQMHSIHSAQKLRSHLATSESISEGNYVFSHFLLRAILVMWQHFLLLRWETFQTKLHRYRDGLEKFLIYLLIIWLAQHQSQNPNQTTDCINNYQHQYSQMGQWYRYGYQKNKVDEKRLDGGVFTDTT